MSQSAIDRAAQDVAKARLDHQATKAELASAELDHDRACGALRAANERMHDLQEELVADAVKGLVTPVAEPRRARG